MTASSTRPDPSPSQFAYIDPVAGALLVDMYGEPVTS